MATAQFLVRHGSYNYGHEGLTPKGFEEAEVARDLLVQKIGVGTSLVLSSTAKRAIQTAVVIGDGLGAEVAHSLRIKVGGERVRAIRSLDDWLGLAVEEAGVSISGLNLVVVTHAPLVAVAMGLSTSGADKLPYGVVHEYIPGSWENPAYSELSEKSANITIKVGEE